MLFRSAELPSFNPHRYHLIQSNPTKHQIVSLLGRLDLGLEHARLNILVGKDRVVVNSTLGGTDMALTVSIELTALDQVKVDGVRPGDREEDERDAHSLPGTDVISNVAKNDRTDSTTANGGDEERSTTLGVATETTESKGEDDGEDARLEEEYNHQHAKTSPVGTSGASSVGSYGCRDEYHNKCLESEKDVTGLAAIVHESSCGETSDGEKSLGDGVEVGSLVVTLSDRKIGACLRKVVDEVRSDTNLTSDVGELSSGTPEESVLLAEGLVNVTGSRGSHLSLVGHVGVGNLRDRSEVEDDSQDTDEGSNTKVNPLDGLKRLSISTNVLEDDLGSEDRSNDGADSLNGLGQLKTELGVLGRTADGDVWVGRCLEGRQTRASKEHGTAEATEASLDSRRPEHKSTDTVDGETENEGVSVTEAAEEPSRVGQGTDEVGTEVGSLETRRLSTSDVKSDLEARVEDIEKTVGKSPHEEEDSDQGDGNDGLAHGKSRSSGNDAVVDRLAANLLINNFSD